MLTIEDLISTSNYSKTTIHILCNRLNIRATRGKIKGNPGKGTYKQEDLDKIIKYKYYIGKQLSVDEATREVLNGAQT